MATYDDILRDIGTTTTAIGTIAGSVDTMISEVGTLQSTFDQAIKDAIDANFSTNLQTAMTGFGFELIPVQADESADPPVYYEKDDKGNLIPVFPIDLYEDSEEDSGTSYDSSGNPLNQSISYKPNDDGTAPKPLSTLLEDADTLPFGKTPVPDGEDNPLQSIHDAIRRLGSELKNYMTAEDVKKTLNGMIPKIASMAVAQVPVPDCNCSDGDFETQPKSPCELEGDC